MLIVDVSLQMTVLTERVSECKKKGLTLICLLQRGKKGFFTTC